jgi:hypothetical protein
MLQNGSSVREAVINSLTCSASVNKLLQAFQTEVLATFYIITWNVICTSFRLCNNYKTPIKLLNILSVHSLPISWTHIWIFFTNSLHLMGYTFISLAMSTIKISNISAMNRPSRFMKTSTVQKLQSGVAHLPLELLDHTFFKEGKLHNAHSLSDTELCLKCHKWLIPTQWDNCT